MATTCSAITLALPAGHPMLSYALLDVALLCFSALTADAIAATLAGLAGYALFQTFVVHTPGDVAGHGAVEVWRFTAVVLSVAIGLTIGRALRLVRQP